MYQRAGEAIRRHDAVEIRGDTGQAWALDGDRVSGEAGNVVGVSHEDVPAGEYGWFLIFGPGSVRTVQEAVVKGAELWPGPAASQGALSSATLGRPVDGINVMAEGADHLAPVQLSYPRIAATASTGTGASNVPDKPSVPAATTQYNLQVTDTGQTSWQPDGGTTDTDPTARAAAAAADAKAVAAQATADGKSNVPDRPATPDAATDYNLRVQADGTASWEEDTVQDTGLPEAPDAQAATARYELEVGTDGAATWQTASDGGGTDQTARDAAAAAQAEADRNGISIGELQHLARDLHTEVEPGTWETADDGVLIASTPDTSGYDSTAFGSATAMVTNTAASNSNTPVSVSIRLPAGADASQYRLVNDLGLVTPGNSWTNRNLGVSPADSSHDYYKRVFVLGEREVSYDWTLQKRSADIDYTHYDGEFRGTFKDGIIDRDALDAQLQADIDAATPLTDDVVLDLVKESRSSADRGKFLGVSADDENEMAFLDAPSGGGSGSTSGPIRWPGLADSFIDWPM